ncbi:MAG: phytanoyl-CoA dioxygenase family protein [Paracoccaceae bacterium]|jgi:phytanoyl-CoA hydroxylase|nr:phytanoyl-CoA dioxygenase family protein [Paracoccaceae bacterium]
MAEALKSSPSKNAKDCFGQDGYLKIEPLFDAAKMVEINAELDRFIAKRVPDMDRGEVYYEDINDRSSIKQMMNMHDHDGYFDDLLENSVIREMAETALGQEVKGVNVEYFNKPPGIGKATPAHQDGYFFHIKPSLAVTGWLALEDVDHENGCLHYVRGSHKAVNLRPHSRSNVLGFSQGMTDFGTDHDKENTVAFPCGAGTFLMHHCKTIHWAGKNRSTTRSRRALGFIYFAKSAEVDKEARAAYQAKLDQELASDNKI